jgi:hypothetical protein
MITSQEIGELATAMAKAQAVIKNPTKEKENPFFKNSKGDASRPRGLIAFGPRCQPNQSLCSKSRRLTATTT